MSITKTLAQMQQDYSKSPAMLGAVRTAIRCFGEDAEAVVVSGINSTNPVSNVSKMAKNLGWGEYWSIPGAKLRYKSQGTKNILVRKS